MRENKKKKRRRRFGDRKDGRKLRTIPPMSRVSPYIMKKRSDAQNHFKDSFDISEAERLIKKKRAEGYKNIGILHIILAAYVRTVATRPGINRFISGQKIYARNNIEVVMVIKKEMSLSAPDTIIKAVFEPTDTLAQVYEKFNALVEKNIGYQHESSFDNTAKLFNYIPGLLLKFTIWFLNLLDYFGLLPGFLLKVSPFHGSLIITSMGSLGIPPIYHHLYDFGNLPIFFAYGAKRTQTVLNPDGKLEKKSFIDFTIVTDERICDGYYYASAFKLMKRYLLNPWVLENSPEAVIEDID